jgi:hypothetical protein
MPGLSHSGSVHFVSSCGESAASLCLFRLGCGLIPAQRLFQVAVGNRPQLGASRMTAPAAHRQVGRRPSVGLEAEPLKKLLFDENFVVAGRQLARVSRQGEGLENVSVDLDDRMVISGLPMLAEPSLITVDGPLDPGDQSNDFLSLYAHDRSTGADTG